MNLNPTRHSEVSPYTILERIAIEMSLVYHQLKEYEVRFKGDDKKKKNRRHGLKEDFFDEATKAASATLAEKTALVLKEAAPDDESARTEAERRYPGWTVETVKYDPKRSVWHIRLKEDPRYKPFSFVDKVNGLVWTRQISAGQADYDIDKLQAENPELWERVSELRRVPKDLQELTPDELALVQQYIYPGPLKVSLAAPKKAKPEDLND